MGGGQSGGCFEGINGCFCGSFGKVSSPSPEVPIPLTGDQITVEFLQKHWSKDIESFEVLPVMAETRPGVEKADGGGASGPSIKRLKLKWKPGAIAPPGPAGSSGEKKPPESVVIKLSNHETEEPPGSMIIRYILAASRFHFPELNANECAWYEQNCKAAVESGYSIVKCYKALATHAKLRRPSDLAVTVCDRRVPYRTMLIMEDIGADFKSPPQAVDLPLDRCQEVVVNMAKLHATYWGRYDTKTNPELKTGSERPVEDSVWLSELVFSANTSKSLISKGLLTFYNGKIRKAALKEWGGDNPKAAALWERFLGCKSPLEDPGVLAALEALQEKLASPEVRARLFDTAGKPQTLCHGDAHGWNHMFPVSSTTRPSSSSDVGSGRAPPVDGVGSSNTPPRLYAIDFQMVGSGRASWDLAYFYSFSAPAVYESDMELLKIYQKELLRVGSRNPNFENAATREEVGSFEALRAEFVRSIVMITLSNVAYLPEIQNVKVLQDQADHSKGDKGETQTYLTLALWKRVFERIANYRKQGLLDEI